MAIQSELIVLLMNYLCELYGKMTVRFVILLNTSTSYHFTNLTYNSSVGQTVLATSWTVTGPHTFSHSTWQT